MAATVDVLYVWYYRTGTTLTPGLNTVINKALERRDRLIHIDNDPLLTANDTELDYQLINKVHIYI